MELYHHFMYFTLGALTTLLFTELAKYTIGRLRPHYLSLCGPRLTSELYHDEFGNLKFVMEPEEELFENHKIRGLSFLSGNSSFSFFCGIFLIIYLWANLNSRFMNVLRPFLQFGMAILSFWVSLTRISDYFHHPLDIIMSFKVNASQAWRNQTLLFFP